MDNHQ
jgi:hypothetical protein